MHGTLGSILKRVVQSATLILHGIRALHLFLLSHTQIKYSDHKQNQSRSFKIRVSLISVRKVC